MKVAAQRLLVNGQSFAPGDPVEGKLSAKDLKSLPDGIIVDIEDETASDEESKPGGAIKVSDLKKMKRPQLLETLENAGISEINGVEVTKKTNKDIVAFMVESDEIQTEVEAE